MNVSRQWLEAFLRQRLDSKDVAERLAMLGAPVDAIEPIGANLEAFVVGLVIEAHQHPNADKLRVTTVDDGSGTLFSVVCGAPNVAAGRKYPFARLGTTMPNGMTIERRKLRGETSEGMLCSARELGLGEDHDGVLTLETDAVPGTPLTEILAGGDERLVVDVTPNRGDLLGHKGVARELAASLGIAYRLPDIPDEAALDLPMPTRFGDEAPVGGVRVAIDDREGCGRLLAAVIRGVKIGPSPEWLRRRLAAVGVRSINNVVDATNYVLHELNQPTHAYDAVALRGPALIARSSLAGERITTLDGVDRVIPAGTLVIADAERAIGIAGVMGGRDTEVTNVTTDIVLECAWFNPVRVRRARRALDLSTDASQRFERGTDRWGAVEAFRRCLRLIVTVAGGVLDGAAVDCYPAPSHPARVFLRPSRVAQVLGVELSWTEIEKRLVALGATVLSKPDDGRIAVDVPGWRPDIVREIDLVEEVARLYGYDRLPVDLGRFRPGRRPDDPAWHATTRLRTALAAAGLSEIVTLPMVATAGPAAPRLLNPLSAEHGVLRDALLPSLVAQVEANWARQIGDIRLFEIGTVFANQAGGQAPLERLQIAFVVTGARRPPHWTDGGKPAMWDRWDAKGLFERVVAVASPDAVISVSGEQWRAERDGRIVGKCASLDAAFDVWANEVASPDAPLWAGAVFGGYVEVEDLMPHHAAFTPLAVYPAVSRDLALVLKGDVAAAALTGLLTERGVRHGLESATIIDEYRGPGSPDDTRSVTVRLIFRAADRTLTDSEVEQALGRLRTSLERERDVTIRTT